MRTDSLSFRLVAIATLWCVAALLAGGMLLSSLFRDYVQRNFDARLVILLEGLVTTSEVDADGQLRLQRSLGEPRFEQPYSGWYWQISDADGPIERSRSLWDQELVRPPEPIHDPIQRYDTMGPEETPIRVVARDIVLPGSETPYRYAVAGDLGEVESEIKRFNGTLAWSLSFLGIGLLAAVVVQVRYGLYPLRRIRQALADIRSGRADRLEGRFPAEITPLASELNALLEHNAQVVERARTHVGNLAHALKTPLSVLANESAAGRGPLAEAVRRQTERMRRQVDHHLSRARTAAAGRIVGARSDAGSVVEDLRRTLARIHAVRAVDIECLCPKGVAFRGERQDLEEMVGNLMDNACKWARSHVKVTVERRGDRLRFVVEDDGSGLSPEQRDQVIERGKRLDEQVSGSGLGLAIADDVARLYGGSIELSDSPLGGLRVVLDLPAAEAATQDA
jgi:signal transduction histidine kinase